MITARWSDWVWAELARSMATARRAWSAMRTAGTINSSRAVVLLSIIVGQVTHSQVSWSPPSDRLTRGRLSLVGTISFRPSKGFHWSREGCQHQINLAAWNRLDFRGGFSPKKLVQELPFFADDGTAWFTSSVVLIWQYIISILLNCRALFPHSMSLAAAVPNTSFKQCFIINTFFFKSANL